LAFQVPETPPRGSNLGRKVFSETPGLKLDSSSSSSPEKTSFTTGKREKLPFPSAEDDEGRHVICQDSIAPWTYLLQIPGKNVRDILIDAFNEWLRCSTANLAVIKQVVGYLHTASLIVDDIEDESLTRRGEPAAHVVFGVARALNAGNCTFLILTLTKSQVQTPTN